jgi:hypothetical protein
MGNLKEWNVPPSTPPDRGSHEGRVVPIYSAMDYGGGIDYDRARWEDPYAFMQAVANVAKEDKEAAERRAINGGEAPDENVYYRVGQDKPGRDATTREGRSELAEDLGLPNKKKKKRKKHGR